MHYKEGSRLSKQLHNVLHAIQGAYLSKVEEYLKNRKGVCLFVFVCVCDTRAEAVGVLARYITL